MERKWPFAESKRESKVPVASVANLQMKSITIHTPYAHPTLDLTPELLISSNDDHEPNKWLYWKHSHLRECIEALQISSLILQPICNTRTLAPTLMTAILNYRFFEREKLRKRWSKA